MMVVVKQSSRHNMWTEITRQKYQREGQRYASDLTDAEGALIEPHMPAAKRLRRPRAIELRAVLDAILYIARTGCRWRMLPKDFPPFTTVQGYFDDGRDNGLFETINFHLLRQAREAAGREAPMQPRRSKGASAILLPTPAVCWSVPRGTPPMSKIAMVRFWSLRQSASYFPGCATFSPIASTTAPT
jgi:transposase